MTSRKTVSLVLGSGGARGLAHIGIIRYLEERGYDIRSISGCSMGAVIGGIYAAGKLDDFSVTVIRQAGLTAPSFTPTTPLTAGAYRWWIRGFAANGKPGKWSAPASFDVGGRPTITAPVATVSAASPLFEWTAVTGASLYSIYIDRVDISGFVFRDDTLTTNSFANVPGLVAGGTYRVWIRAVSASGVLSPWSFPVAFSVT